MRLHRRMAAAALASLLACDHPTEPMGRGAGLALQIDAGAAAGLDSGYVLVRGPTSKTVKVMPGQTVTIDGLIPGTYTVAVEGFESGAIARFFQATGVTVVANQNASVTATATEFTSFVPTMLALPPSGTSTTFTVNFGSVVGALSYEVEAATDEAFTANRVAVPATQTSAQVTVTTAGTYYVRVRAIDAYQGRGLACPFQTIQVAAPPTILLSTTTANFGATQGGANPAAQTISVNNSGGATLSGLSASVSYTTGSGWLAASLSTTTAPSTLTLTPTTGSLASGIYRATVSVASGVAGNSPQTVSVTFTVGVAPTIVLSSSSNTFNATRGEENPAAQTVSVTNGSGGTLSGLSASVSYTTGSDWLSASLNTTTAPSTLTLAATTGSLAPGTYMATVFVASSVASNSPQTINVTFTVAPAPAIVLSTTNTSFNATQGQANPAGQAVDIANGGAGTLTGLTANVSYTTGSGWLSATLNTNTAPSTLTLQPTTGSLAAGTYTATVAVASSVASNSPQTVSVTFIVAAPPPAIALLPTSRTFSAMQAGASPAAQTVSVTNSGGGTLSGLSAAVAYTAGQPTGWLAASLNTTTAPSTLTLTATTGSLTLGTYTASVTVASGVASNSPQTVSVTFVVAGPGPAIVLSSTNNNFNATQGANPAPQTVTITNGGGGTLNGLSASVSYTTGSGWLSATLNTTTAPSTLTLQPTTGSLAAGTYSATVSIASGVASNSPQTVSVTFTVAAAPTIVLSSTSNSFSATRGGANPAAQTVSVTNGVGGTLSGLSASVSYTTGSGWLSASLSTTTAPSTLTLQPTTGSLLAGTYTATVSIASGVATNSPQTVSVTFTVAPAPTIVLSSSSNSFNATQGGGNPAAQTVSVTNGVGGTLSGLSATVSYTTGSGWLSASLNTTTAPSTLTLAATTGSLAAGTYTATVSVASGVASNSPQTVGVTFTVAAAPTIVLSSTSNSFSATQGGVNPAAQTVSVTNGVGGTLSGLSASVSYTTGSGWLTASLNTTTAPSTLTLTAATGALTAGTYTATVSVASGVASNSPQTVSVTFNVAAAPTIVLSSTSNGFNATQGGPNPTAQTVSVTNGVGGTLNGLSATISYTTGSGWLSATLNTTTAPSTLTLQPTTSTLVAGVYTATVSVASGVASNSPQTVSVTFTVAPPPSVTINQAAGQSDPTNASPILFTVTFSEPVTEFGGNDVSFAGSTVGGTLAASVSGSGASYTVSVTGMAGSGTVRASIPAGAAISSVGAPTAASTSTDNTVTFDNVAPSVTINQAAAQSDPTNASPILFTVTFSEPVSGFAGSDVSFTGSTAGGTLAASVSGSGASYTVSVTGMTSTGTVRASIPAAAAIDAAANPSGASTSTDNTVTFNNAVPSVTINQAAVQSDPTNASPILFTVVFSEAVTGFINSDVSFTGSTVGGTLAASVSGSGASYTVSVTGMAGSGTVTASIPAGAAVNGVGTPTAASTSTDNTVTFDNVVPSVTINQAAAQSDPTNASPILFTVTFSEPVLGFTGSDVSFTGSTVGGTLAAGVSGSGATYTVSVTGMTGNGTVVASVPAAAATDLAGNASGASTSADNTVTFQSAAPTVTINQAAAQSDPTNASPILFTVVFSEAVTGFIGSDVSFTGSTVGGALAAGVSGSGASYTVSVTGMTGIGTVIASIPAGAATNGVGTGNSASASVDNTVTFDNVAPSVTINQAAAQSDPTSAGPILFTVTFSEPVSAFAGNDVSFTGSTAGGTPAASVSGSGASYTVSVTGMTSTGTVVASIPAAAVTDLAGNPNGASTSVDNQVTFNSGMGATSASVVGGGTGYNTGNLVTLSGGTGTPTQLTVSSVATVSATGIAAGIGYGIGTVLTVSGGTGTAATLTVSAVKAASAAVTAAGSGYNAGSVLTVTGGTGTAATLTVSTVTAASAAVVAAGTGYNIGNVLTVSGGTGTAATLTVNAVAAASATVSTPASGYDVGDVLTVTGGTGTAATLTVTSRGGAGNITGISVTTPGSYAATPANPVSVTGGTGSGARFNLSYGVSGVSITTAGSYTANPTNPVAVTGGAGAGATFNLSFGVSAVTVTTAGSYTATPVNPVAVTGGTGTGAAFNVSYGVGTVTVTTGGSYTANPANPVSVTSGTGAGATFNLSHTVTGVTVTTPGSYTVTPANPAAATGGAGTGATFNVSYAP